MNILTDFGPSRLGDMSLKKYFSSKTLIIISVDEIYMYISVKPTGQALGKAPRWAKICSKSFQSKTCFDFVILSLYIYIYFKLTPLEM